MHMSSLACLLVVLSQLCTPEAVCSTLIMPVTVLVFLDVPIPVLSLLLDFRLTEGKHEVFCNFMSHFALSRVRAQ